MSKKTVTRWTLDGKEVSLNKTVIISKDVSLRDAIEMLKRGYEPKSFIRLNKKHYTFDPYGSLLLHNVNWYFYCELKESN